MSPNVSIKLNPPYNGRFYTDDDVISGTVEVVLKTAATIKGLDVALKGTSQSLTLEETDQRQHRQSPDLLAPYTKEKSTHVIFHQGLRLYPPVARDDKSEGKHGEQIPGGTYNYNFDFRLSGGPRCRSKHVPGGISFLEETGTEDYGRQLPPSFNDKHVAVDVTTPELFFYYMGKVRYTVQADLELAGDKKWSSGKEPIRDTRIITFLPSQCQAYMENVLSASACSDKTLVDTARATKVYKDSSKLVLSGGLAITAELRLTDSVHLHRMDHLFRQGDGKLNPLFMVFSGNPAGRRIELTRVQCSLFERVDYVANGKINKNTSQLKIIDANVSHVLPLEEAKIVEDGFMEIQVDLGSEPALRNLRFNEEDYVHRGNRLFSFVTCNIRREYHLQLALHWKIDKTALKSIIGIDPVTVFAEVAAPPFDGLPAYLDEPPKYKA